MKYVVLGLGISGQGAVNLLKSKKLDFIIVDDKKAIKSVDAIELIEKEDIIVKSPGISWANPLLSYAIKNGIRIISEIDLALDYLDKKTKIIAITGTNGKTTIVTKIYELLNFVGFKASLGGNEGHSLCDIVIDSNIYDYIVLELSSYQLENNPKIKPYIALITNLTPDHLTRYNSVMDYYLTKFNIFKNQDENDYMIIDKNEKMVNSLLNQKFLAKKIYIENKGENLVYENEVIIAKKDMLLKGEHNAINMLFLIAVAKIIGISSKKIEKFLKIAKSLEHRIEEFFVKENTHFINDSKGTNVESSLVALDSFKGSKVYLIVGGKDKKIDNTKLYEKIYEINAIPLIIGENKLEFTKEFNKTGYKHYVLDNLENVMEFIKNNIDFKEEQYILLSPATSSFDQFNSFEHRGKVFKQLVISNFGEKNE
ncbi:UDP-N-acetylmuramoyl-L-alanine--D-glutamate ligase [Oceanivirga miroungae]|uniref:UDP-N-acetylmuramoylalanine--D-glutamate ligase n=1 Tax=Oceanivirga miroungae TaxID=1130046 RepID=A0A6I8MEA1_9FUSO|nr:UDP-N-acetylmuramoyl-L-alanine--D-glutamate ligase [Oceanivirga miroungae]VWL85795.1 UDP-N-acetylmuramoylalanine-D-glutamate ligase [Oceanivirga miroungae]